MRYLLFLILLCLSMSASSQIINGDFEDWPTNVVASSTSENEYFPGTFAEGLPDGWISSSSAAPAGFFQSSSATLGDFALGMYTWYMFWHATATQRGELEARPYSLKGSYKYILADPWLDTSDVASIDVVISDEDGELLGTASVELDTVSTYQDLELVIDYTSTGIPDTFEVTLRNARTSCSIYGICKYFFVDNLRFTYTSQVEDQLASPNLLLKPNPSDGYVRFSETVDKVSVYDPTGRLAHEDSNIDDLQLDVPSGLYAVRMQVGNRIETSQLSIIR